MLSTFAQLMQIVTPNKKSDLIKELQCTFKGEKEKIMSIFMMLKNIKGTVSSALGKELAKEVLNANSEILFEAIELVNYEIDSPKEKNIRAGAAKIIEKVAEKEPQKIAQYLEKLIPALNVAEPQTRWMIIQVFGYCAKLNTAFALKGFEYAKRFIDENAGVCLSSAAALYLGYIGELSKEQTKKVFPVLKNALETASENEVDWILEAFCRLFDNLDKEEKIQVCKYSELYLNSRKKSTIKRAEKILKKASIE